MREPLPRFLFVKISKDSFTEAFHDSWLNRVRENLAQLLLPSPLKPSSANGAPLHLLQLDKSLRPARAQGASLFTHAAVVTAVVLLIAHGPTVTAPVDPKGPTTISALSPNLLRAIFGPRASDSGARGGNSDPLPARRGDLPPYSSLVLVRPSIPTNHDAQVPIPPTLLDPNAAPVLAPTPNIGLPWMTRDENSGGPGKGHTLGSAGGDNLGDGGNGQAGEDNGNARYGPNFVAPICAYCPYPTYSDDARKAKVQGAVRLRVLVGADGRAQDVRMVEGIGFGLDERAIETVHNWKFIPARDSARRPVATWVTIEAVFRLF